MYRPLIWLLVSSLITAGLRAQAEAIPDGPADQVKRLLAATEEERPGALVAVIKARMATNVVFAGQYTDLMPASEHLAPLVVTWLDAPPAGISKPDPFRVACINVLRDLITDSTEELRTTLRALAEDDFEAEAVRQNAVFALAQFGDRALIEEQLREATRQTKAKDQRLQFTGWNALANIHYNARAYDAAVEAYKHAAKILEAAGQQQALQTIYYNCACSLALSGHTGTAIDYIEKALKLSAKTGRPFPRQMLDSDMDIVTIRGTDRFKALINRHFGEPSADGTDK